MDESVNKLLEMFHEPLVNHNYAVFEYYRIEKDPDRFMYSPAGTCFPCMIKFNPHVLVEQGFSFRT